MAGGKCQVALALAELCCTLLEEGEKASDNARQHVVTRQRAL